MNSQLTPLKPRAVQVVHHVHDQRIYASEILGERSDMQRSPTLAALLPAPERRFIKTNATNLPGADDYPRGVTSANLKSGLVRVSIHWGGWRPEHRLDDARIIAICKRLHTEVLNQPGRPENWPFPTWGGRHG